MTVFRYTPADYAEEAKRDDARDAEGAADWRAGQERLVSAMATLFEHVDADTLDAWERDQ